MPVTISLDAMGGDQGLNVVVPAALCILKKHSDVNLILVGNSQAIKSLLKHEANSFADRLQIQHASEVVAMDESPALALRSKKDSSLRVAVNLVKTGQADACVSAGNTGALMATARFVLKTLPGINRPAIVKAFPTHKGRQVRLLDLGANVDLTPENLLELAIMGSALTEAVDNIKKPRVGLLNIGEEEIKGNELVKKTAEIFSASQAINYIGYIEGDALFSDKADVVVCDGFVGNIALKVIEGVVKFIQIMAKEAFMQSWWRKLLALFSIPMLKKLKKRIDPDRQNGATFLGLNGIVVKSHGGANVKAFAHAIEEAILEANQNVTQHIKAKLVQLIESQEPTS